jgi:hypothetical protein
MMAISLPLWYLLAWSFRRSLFNQTTVRTAGRAEGSVLWFPGRWGGLVRKEQVYLRRNLLQARVIEPIGTSFAPSRAEEPSCE